MLERLRRGARPARAAAHDAAPTRGVLRRPRGRRGRPADRRRRALLRAPPRHVHVAGARSSAATAAARPRSTTPSCSRGRRRLGARRTRARSSPRLWETLLAQPVPRHPPGHLDHRGQRARAGRPGRRSRRAPTRSARRRAPARGDGEVPVNTRAVRAATRSSSTTGGTSVRRRAAVRRRRASSRRDDGDAVTRRARTPDGGVVARERAPARDAAPGGAVALARPPRDRPRGARRARQPPRALRGPPGRLGRVGHRPGPPRDARGLRRPPTASPAIARAARCAPRSPSSAGRRASRLRQTIRLDAGARRLEFHTDVDWHEDHRLLKVAFPLAVHADEATYEIAFGVVRRPTHYSTRHDLAASRSPATASPTSPSTASGSRC